VYADDATFKTVATMNDSLALIDSMLPIELIIQCLDATSSGSSGEPTYSLYEGVQRQQDITSQRSISKRWRSFWPQTEYHIVNRNQLDRLTDMLERDLDRSQEVKSIVLYKDNNHARNMKIAGLLSGTKNLTELVVAYSLAVVPELALSLAKLRKLKSVHLVFISVLENDLLQ
jgi:hypothetical protein